MKLSTKGRHAITAMMELALKHPQGPVTLTDISTEQSISVSYLDQLFARLRKAGLVTGTGIGTRSARQPDPLAAPEQARL